MAAGSTSTGTSFDPLGNPYSSPGGYLQTKSNKARSLTAAGSPPETQTARILSTASAYLHTPEDQILAALAIKGRAQVPFDIFSSDLRLKPLFSLGRDYNKAHAARAASKIAANKEAAICICWFKRGEGEGELGGQRETAKVIHILSAGCIDSDHQSPAHTSFTPAFRGRPKVTPGQRIWREMKRHAKPSCQPTASADKVIPTRPHVPKTKTF